MLQWMCGRWSLCYLQAEDTQRGGVAEEYIDEIKKNYTGLELISLGKDA